MRRLAAVLVAFVALVPVTPALAAAPATVTYRPPVDAPVVDGFRPPPENWNAGNRGIEYGTRAGAPVGASADGEVVFAGPIAGEYHVVVLHADGIRTSYSYLSAISVRRGDHVRQGQVVGTTGATFHFGARAGDAYIDPDQLFGGGPPEVHLVPDEERQPKPESEERSGLLRVLAGFGSRAVKGGAAAVGSSTRHEAPSITPPRTTRRPISSASSRPPVRGGRPGTPARPTPSRSPRWRAATS